MNGSDLKALIIVLKQNIIFKKKSVLLFWITIHRLVWNTGIEQKIINISVLFIFKKIYQKSGDIFHMLPNRQWI